MFGKWGCVLLTWVFKLLNELEYFCDLWWFFGDMQIIRGKVTFTETLTGSALQSDVLWGLGFLFLLVDFISWDCVRVQPTDCWLWVNHSFGCETTKRDGSGAVVLSAAVMQLLHQETGVIFGNYWQVDE